MLEVRELTIICVCEWREPEKWKKNLLNSNYKNNKNIEMKN